MAGWVQPSPIEPQKGSLATSASPVGEFFVPDFCRAGMVLAVVLISELLALILALSRWSPGAFWIDLARLSVFAQWLGLTGAALLCYGRSRLARLPVAVATVLIFVLLMGNTALFSTLAVWVGNDPGGLMAGMGPTSTDVWHLVVRNEAICVIVTSLLLRYFYVAHQWQRHVRAEARLRLDALQARIRPHFLFNSMNTIAALTRTDPARAEEAVEDLADLFRATLGDPQRPITIKEELEVARIHQRIEELRMGDRLKVKWDIAGIPLAATMPSLTLQPLLENAIYHGVERLEAGGTVVVCGRVNDGRLELSVTNPLPPPTRGGVRQGNGTALDNIRERLWLAYGDDGTLEVTTQPDTYKVTLRFPVRS